MLKEYQNNIDYTKILELYTSIIKDIKYQI